MYVAIFGSQQRLSYAELKRVHPESRPYSESTATFNSDPSRNLGGTVKIGKVLDEVKLKKGILTELLVSNVEEYIPKTDKKISIGISVVDGKVNNYKEACFQIKKKLRRHGYRPRIVLGSNQALTSAQVIHNKLDTPSNTELLICIGDKSALIAKTCWVQDIDSYSKRDMGRPCRDMQTGMLPPKLAQIMINLAGGEFVYDPFCGSGVILQEALLMNKRAGGSDIQEKMINCTKRNLDWLQKHYKVNQPEELLVEDARKLKLPRQVSTVVTEGYLGPVMHQQPTLSEARQLAEQSDNLLQETLTNIHPQLSQGSILCLAAPSWQVQGRQVTPTVVDDCSELGYNHLRLEDVTTADLLYKRKSQYVGRQLILLERK